MSPNPATGQDSVWNPWGSTTNIWNSQQNDGSVPWSQVFAGAPVGSSIPNGQVPTYPGSTAWSGSGGGIGGGGGGPAYSPNTANDSYLNAALDRLKGTVSGQNVPFDANTKNNMLSKASDMNAASEASNAQDVQAQIAANGGSAMDASSQAALRALKSTRQGANAQAAQGIESQANLANFGAQETAANDLSTTRLRQASVDPNYNGAASTVGGVPGVRPPATGGGGATATAGATTGAPTANPATGDLMNPDGTYVGHPSWWKPIAQPVPNGSYGWQTGSGFGSTSRGSATLAG